MWRRDITQTGAKPLDTLAISSCVRCLASFSIFYQTKRWHIPQASKWRRHGSQHLEYNTLSLLNTSFPECTPRWKRSCWLVGKALFLFMLHCVDIDSNSEFLQVRVGLRSVLLSDTFVRTSFVAWRIGGMSVEVERRSTEKRIGPSAKSVHHKSNRNCTEIKPLPPRWSHTLH